MRACCRIASRKVEIVQFCHELMNPDFWRQIGDTCIHGTELGQNWDRFGSPFGHHEGHGTVESHRVVEFVLEDVCVVQTVRVRVPATDNRSMNRGR